MPSEKARQEKERRAELQERHREPELTPKERRLYPDELVEAVRLIYTVADRFERGDRYDRMLASDLRGIARGVEGHGTTSCARVSRSPVPAFRQSFPQSLLVGVERAGHHAGHSWRVFRRRTARQPPAGVRGELEERPAPNPCEREHEQQAAQPQKSRLRYESARRIPTASYTRIAGAFSERTNSVTAGTRSSTHRQRSRSPRCP